MTAWGLLLVLLTAARAAEWEPRQWPSPALGVSAAAPEQLPSSGPLERAYRAYRKRSARDGSTCSFYPTCSGYAMIAARRFGPAVGTLLAVDRLLREYPGQGRLRHYPIVTPHGTPRLNDPVPDQRPRDGG